MVWANSELDGLCFGAVAGDHRVRGTAMDRPDIRSVGRLEEILGEVEWLVDGEFSIADVAVGSYLNYVPIFFGNANLGAPPNIVDYMKRCAERPANCVFLPCSHKVWCTECTALEQLATCPICSTGITQSLKTFHKRL